MTFVCDKRRHLVCLPYSVENLHRMADKMNLKRHWFHKNHYDIPKRRQKLFESVLPVVSSKIIVTIIKRKLNFIDPFFLPSEKFECEKLLKAYAKVYEHRS